MKNLLVLVMIVVIALCTTAHAAVQNMNGWFSIDVPAGWTVHQAEEELFVSITSLDGSGIVTFEYASVEEMDSRQFADNKSGSLGGSSPVEIERGEYEFVLTDGTLVRAFMVGSVGIVIKTQYGFESIYDMLKTLTL